MFSYIVGGVSLIINAPIMQFPVFYQILEAMGKDSAIPLQSLQVDGGMTANQLLMQLQADLLGLSVGNHSQQRMFSSRLFIDGLTHKSINEKRMLLLCANQKYT